MEQLIRNVTTSITNQLSGNKSFYTSDDLREYDIPEFLIQRVEVEIYRNLNESIVPPHSEWADMSADDVEQAWEQFIEAIVAEVRMPSSFAKTVFETAIADVMEMILQPRKAIPDILFGSQKTLKADEVEKRLSFITVNSHLAQAVYKYMKRKGLAEIEIGTARRVVMKVDERITVNYNSLNWAQLLQPLFILAGPKIDTELFRIFFRDRNMDRISRRFDLLNGSLNKIEFIETLSSPDLLNEEGYEEDQVSLFDIQTTDDGGTEENSDQVDPQDRDTKNKNSAPVSTEAQDDKKSSATTTTYKSEISVDDNEDQPTEDTERDNALDPAQGESQNETDDSIFGSFHDHHRLEEADLEEPDDILKDNPEGDSQQEKKDEDLTPDLGGDEMPLYVRFDADEDDSEGLNDYEEDKDDDETDERFAEQILYEEESSVEDDTDDLGESVNNPMLHEEAESEEIDDKTGDGEITNKETSETDEESPMWQSYLGEDEYDDEEDDNTTEYSGYADLDDEDTVEQEDAPLIDLTIQENEGETAEQLVGWLKDDEDRFRSYIFGGSDKAYEEALIDLNQLDNWNQASRFIEKEIFARNLIDMYDEEAVDFTDRLQAYFDEYKS
jgi:hypothetical protein